MTAAATCSQRGTRAACKLIDETLHLILLAGMLSSNSGRGCSPSHPCRIVYSNRATCPVTGLPWKPQGLCRWAGSLCTRHAQPVRCVNTHQDTSEYLTALTILWPPKQRTVPRIATQVITLQEQAWASSSSYNNPSCHISGLNENPCVLHVLTCTYTLTFAEAAGETASVYKTTGQACVPCA